MDPFSPVPALPDVAVAIDPPDLGPWRAGNAGVAGVVSLPSGAPGPHVALVSLIHGNEIAGAVVLDRLLRRRPAVAAGRLTVVFANLEAFDRFDAADPTASRFVDEDLNRIWDNEVLEGPRVSSELMRGRQLRRVIDEADVVLDLHSMLWDGAPLILCGETARGRLLARSIGTPRFIVADRGHVGGRRLIDYSRFADPAGHARSCLVEAGQHWRPGTIDTTERAVGALLAHLGVAAPDARAAPSSDDGPLRCAEVTETVTATTAQFAFVSPFRGGDTVARAGTTIATDGATAIRTPYDDCILVMPNLRPTRGHTAVRLARYLPDDSPAPKM